MDIEKILTEGIVFKKAKDESGRKEVRKVKTKAKKTGYVKGTHNTVASKKKAERRKKRDKRLNG